MTGLDSSLKERLVGYGRVVSDGGIRVSGFYETFGFRRRPDDAPGMFLYLLPD